MVPFSLAPLPGIVGCQFPGRQTCFWLGLCHWPGTQAERLWQFFMSIQPYWVGGLWAGDEELADFELADSSTGSHLSPSLMQDA